MTSGRFQLNGDNENDDGVDRSASTNNSTLTTTRASTSERINERTEESSASENLRDFIFTSADLEKLEIKIPELLQSGYSFYTWRCAPILAWFLWERRHSLAGKRLLELGSGTSLPGILAAKCGAHVTLSDNCLLPKSLAHIRKSCLANKLVPGQDIEVIGLSWGLLLNSVFNIGPLDLIIAADCFYDPTVFEDIIVSVSFLLERNPLAKFVFTYQERSADWSIESLLKKWNLIAYHVNIDDIGKTVGVDLLELMGGHTIHLIEVSKEH